MAITKEERFERAVGVITTTAKMAAPGEPRQAIELMLLAAVSYCKHELKMPTKEACNSIDMLLTSLFEDLDAGAKS